MLKWHLGPAAAAKLSHLDGVTLRVNEDVRKTVIFFGVPGPDGIEYGGTGFLLADFDNGILMPFLVTARHVAKTLEEYSDTGFFIRMNRRDGESEPVPVNSIKWAYHPNKQVDVAATYFSIPINEYDAVYYPLRDSCFTTEDRIATYEHPDDIRCGDPISIVGLFRLHAGSKRNVPIVHNGHIAALPDPREKIPLIKRGTDDLIEVEGYLVEAQTLDGFKRLSCIYE